MAGRVLVVGDLHGCFDEFVELLDAASFDHTKDLVVATGDLADRGPASDKILDWFMHGWMKGYAKTVMGNHDWKLLRLLAGRPVKVAGGLAKTIEQLKPWSQRELDGLFHFLARLDVTWFSPECGLLVVHGAFKAELTGNDFFNTCIYGEVSDELDEHRHKIRLDNWKKEYSGILQHSQSVGDPEMLDDVFDIQTDIVHGHIVVNPCPEVFKTESGAEIIDIDGGCVFGGDLVGITYPDKTIYKVKAKEVYHGDPPTVDQSPY